MRRAYTIIELLVVIAIVSILLGITLPAIQAARESSRRTSCSNHIYQLSRAIIDYESKWRTYPGGGWGGNWLAVKGRINRQQPAGWTYNVLPHIERQTEYDNNNYHSVLMSDFICPTRRTTEFYDYGNSYLPSIVLPTSTRSDYAINGGSAGSCPSIDALIRSNIKSNTEVVICHKPPGSTRGNGGNSIKQKIGSLSGSGHRHHKHDHVGICGACNEPLDVLLNQPGCQPSSLNEGDQWLSQDNTTKFLNRGLCGILPDITDGIVGRMVNTTNAHLIDGASNVYLIGEKYVYKDGYGITDGDNRSMFVGFSSNNVRWGYDPPQTDGELNIATIFGAAHPSVFIMSFADGRVQSTTYDIDPDLHFILCGRNNGTLP